MAFGPNKTLPVGTYKRWDIERLVNQIDEMICNTEGDEVHIHHNRFQNIVKYKDELIKIYLLAGWPRVEWISTHNKVCEPHLLLSNVKKY